MNRIVVQEQSVLNHSRTFELDYYVSFLHAQTSDIAHDMTSLVFIRTAPMNILSLNLHCSAVLENNDVFKFAKY